MHAVTDVYHSRELLWNLTLRELRTKYRRSFLGWAWSMLNPLSQILIYGFVFGTLFDATAPIGDPRGLDNFALYLLCGLLPWNFFRLVTSLGLGAISANSGLVRRVAFPREVLVFSNVLHACVQFSIEMALLLIVLLIAGSPFLPWLPRRRAHVGAARDLRHGSRDGAQRARGLLPRRQLPLGDRDPGVVLRHADRVPAVAARGEGARPGSYNLLKLNPMNGFVETYRRLLYDAARPAGRRCSDSSSSRSPASRSGGRSSTACRVDCPKRSERGLDSPCGDRVLDSIRAVVVTLDPSRDPGEARDTIDETYRRQEHARRGARGARTPAPAAQRRTHRRRSETGRIAGTGRNVSRHVVSAPRTCATCGWPTSRTSSRSARCTNNNSRWCSIRPPGESEGPSSSPPSRSGRCSAFHETSGSPLEQATLFSIVTPVYNPPEHAFRSCIDSVLGQSYENWEWCLADDGSSDPHVEALLRVAEADPRVKVVRGQSNEGIVAASNRAADWRPVSSCACWTMTTSSRTNALDTVADAVQRVSRRRLSLLGRGQDRFRRQPLRPVLQARLVARAPARSELLLAPVDHPTFGLRGGRRLSLRVRRLAGLRPRAAGHRSTHAVSCTYPTCCITGGRSQGSTASDFDAKPQAFTAALDALQGHLDRTGQDGDVEQTPSGYYRVRRPVIGEPMVSIIMPTRGSSKSIWGQTTCLATNAVRSIVERSTYQNFEVVLVHDSSTPECELDTIGRVLGERFDPRRIRP